MGYECPVCGVPQVDARHLANHLAFTALLHGEDHEAWLDEHVPEWSTRGEAYLAERAVEHATEVDDSEAFGGAKHEHQHDTERSGQLFDDQQPFVERGRKANALDGEAQAILEEAQRLTEEAKRDDE